MVTQLDHESCHRFLQYFYNASSELLGADELRALLNVPEIPGNRFSLSSAQRAFIDMLCTELEHLNDDYDSSLNTVLFYKAQLLGQLVQMLRENGASDTVISEFL